MWYSIMVQMGNEIFKKIKYTRESKVIPLDICGGHCGIMMVHSQYMYSVFYLTNI